MMVKNGFDDVTSHMAKKADMDHGFQGVDKKFNVVIGRLDHLDARMDTLEHDVADINKHFVYRDEFESALDRILAIEKHLGIRNAR